MPAGTVTDRAIFGAPAHVRPVLRWLQSQVPYIVVLTDRTGADISAFRDAAHPLTPVRVDGPDDEIERNAPGGWSQPRYQRRAEDSWEHNAAAVADEVARAVRAVGADLVIVGGDVRAVQLLGKELATPRHRDLVIEHLTGGRHPDGSAEHHTAHIDQIVRGHIARRSAALQASFADQRGPSGLAVEGADATLKALADGRVGTLFVTSTETLHPKAWFAPSPEIVALHPGEVAKRHQPLQEGPLADVAVRAALLGSAGVHVLDAEDASVLADGVGALCRFHS
jgi:hypothetical protein